MPPLPSPDSGLAILGEQTYPGGLLTTSQKATTNIVAFTSPVRACIEEQHCIILEANPELTFINLLASMDLQTEEIKCQHTFFLPFELMHHILGKNLTPKEAFFITQPLLAGKG